MEYNFIILIICGVMEVAMKTGLVLEGGALRAIFSSGVCDALVEGKVTADYVVGVSAGIAYAMSPDSPAAIWRLSPRMPRIGGIWA